MSTLVIVRHGNTFAPGEAPRRIGARTDLPLVESGRVQAEALARHFTRTGLRFGRALVSPSRRCQETAATILTRHAASPEPETCAWLGEIDHGPDEDRPETEVIARIGAETLARWDEEAIAPPGWQVDAEPRISAWRAVLAIDEAAPVLLVTSNGAARFALLCDEDLREQAARLPSLKLRTGAWGRLAITRGRAKIDAWDERP